MTIFKWKYIARRQYLGSLEARYAKNSAREFKISARADVQHSVVYRLL
jgi:hypothetical protein